MTGHSMITRSKSGIFKPKLYSTCAVNDEPKNYDQTSSNENRKIAMEEEIKY